MLKTVFLSDAFYKAYPTDKYKEIEQKTDRPYVRIQVIVNGVVWGIPLRSNITHNHAIWTDKENGCGLDFTKAVVIEKPAEYISSEKPHIRDNEFNVIKQIDSHFVTQKLQQYIKTYNKAKTRLDIERNRILVQCSTLQYFEKYI